MASFGNCNTMDVHLYEPQKSWIPAVTIDTDQQLYNLVCVDIFTIHKDFISEA